MSPKVPGNFFNRKGETIILEPMEFNRESNFHTIKMVYGKYLILVN